MITMDSSARRWVYGICAVVANALFILLVIWAESFDPNWKPLLWGMIALGGLVGFFVATSRTGVVGNVLPGIVALAAGLLAAGSLLSLGASGEKVIVPENVPFVGYVLLYLSIGALAGALLGIFFRNIITTATQTERETLYQQQKFALEQAKNDLGLAEDLYALRKAEVEVARRFPTLRRKQIDVAKRTADMNRQRVMRLTELNPPVAEFEYQRYDTARRIIRWLGTVEPAEWTEVHSKTLATMMEFEARLPIVEMPTITDQPAIAPADGSGEPATDSDDDEREGLFLAGPISDDEDA